MINLPRISPLSAIYYYLRNASSRFFFMAGTAWKVLPGYARDAAIGTAMWVLIFAFATWGAYVGFDRAIPEEVEVAEIVR
jgi:hypothetical protein